MNVWDLTPHQLDVLRTLGSLAGGVGGFLAGVGAVYSYLARKWARQAAHQTRSEQWVDGRLHTMDVAEIATHAMHTTQEVKDMLPRGNGRRRLPTTEIPTRSNEHE